MKNLAKFLGCSVVAFAIGCGDGADTKPVTTTPVVDPAKDPMMKAAMENPAEAKPADPAAGEKTEGEAAPAEKKEGDAAPAEKKEGDAAPAEKKEGDAAPAEKKE